MSDSCPPRTWQLATSGEALGSSGDSLASCRETPTMDLPVGALSSDASCPWRSGVVGVACHLTASPAPSILRMAESDRQNGGADCAAPDAGQFDQRSRASPLHGTCVTPVVTCVAKRRAPNHARCLLGAGHPRQSQVVLDTFAVRLSWEAWCPPEFSSP